MRRFTKNYVIKFWLSVKKPHSRHSCSGLGNDPAPPRRGPPENANECWEKLPLCAADASKQKRCFNEQQKERPKVRARRGLSVL